MGTPFLSTCPRPALLRSGAEIRHADAAVREDIVRDVIPLREIMEVCFLTKEETGDLPYLPEKAVAGDGLARIESEGSTRSAPSATSSRAQSLAKAPSMVQRTASVVQLLGLKKGMKAKGVACPLVLRARAGRCAVLTRAVLWPESGQEVPSLHGREGEERRQTLLVFCVQPGQYLLGLPYAVRGPEVL